MLQGSVTNAAIWYVHQYTKAAYATVTITTDIEFVILAFFIPSFSYYLEITSSVLLSDPEETFSVQTGPIELVVDPQPPGPINTTANNLHPQTLFLSRARSLYCPYLNRYRITMGGF